MTWASGGPNPVVLLVQFRPSAGAPPITQQTFGLPADVYAGESHTFTNISVTAPNTAAEVLEVTQTAPANLADVAVHLQMNESGVGVVAAALQQPVTPAVP